MSDEIRTADEAIEAAAQVAQQIAIKHRRYSESESLENAPSLVTIGEHRADGAMECAAAIRALAARTPERDDEALEKIALNAGRNTVAKHHRGPNWGAMNNAFDEIADDVARTVLAALREAGALK